MFRRRFIYSTLVYATYTRNSKILWYSMIRYAGRKEKERKIYDNIIILAKIGILYKSGSLEELSYGKTSRVVLYVVFRVRAIPGYKLLKCVSGR